MVHDPSLRDDHLFKTPFPISSASSYTWASVQELLLRWLCSRNPEALEDVKNIFARVSKTVFQAWLDSSGRRVRLALSTPSSLGDHKVTRLLSMGEMQAAKNSAEFVQKVFDEFLGTVGQIFQTYPEGDVFLIDALECSIVESNDGDQIFSWQQRLAFEADARADGSARGGQ